MKLNHSEQVDNVNVVSDKLEETVEGEFLYTPSKTLIKATDIASGILIAGTVLYFGGHAFVAYCPEQTEVVTKFLSSIFQLVNSL